LKLQQNLSAVQKVYFSAENLLNSLDTERASAEEVRIWEKASLVLLSLSCLAEYLHGVLKINHIPAMKPFGSQDFLQRRLRASGWCVQEIALMKARLRSPS
jgi:hypothetical protein